MAAYALWTACLVSNATLGAAATLGIPPPAAGIADLKFAEIYEPIGGGGLRYSRKSLALDGRKVRILGYMVERDAPVPGLLLLAPVPVRLHEREAGEADDLPAATLFVIVPDRAAEILPHTPGPLLLTGTLQLGNREESDGRISSVRLILDPEPTTGSNAPHTSQGGMPR
jgi:hypothetical protein